MSTVEDSAVGWVVYFVEGCQGQEVEEILKSLKVSVGILERFW